MVTVKIKKFIAMLSMTGLLSMSIVGLPTQAAMGAAANNNELKIGVAQEFETLNPLISQMAVSTYISAMTTRSLMSMDSKSSYYPQLLESIPSLENGQAKFVEIDGKKKIVANFVIRENAKWGDGVDVTGNDLYFTWQTALNDKVSVGDRETYENIEKLTVDAQNPKKFTIQYRQAKWDYARMAGFPVLPKHLEEPVFNASIKESGGYEKNSIFVKDPTNPGLYCGPYRVAELKLGSHVILVPNKTFYGEAAKIKKIIFKLVPNTGTMEANLRAGNIDMISIFGLSFDQALVFEKKVNSDKLPFKVLYEPSLVYEHLDLQFKNPILKDVNVRKALVFATDRQKLTDALFEGKLKPAIHNLAPIDPWYIDDPAKIVIYPSSKRKAKQLLDDAGWKMRDDGFRYKDGKKLTLQMMTTSGNKTRELVETFLQDQWKSVGIDLTIKNEPSRVFFGETVRKGTYPGLALFAWTSSPENSPRSTVSTKSIPSKENSFAGQNSGGYTNPEVDVLLDQLDVEFDAAKRLELVQKILYHYTNDVAAIPLYYRAEVAVVPLNLKNYKLHGHQFSDSNFVETWSLE